MQLIREQQRGGMGVWIQLSGLCAWLVLAIGAYAADLPAEASDPRWLKGRMAYEDGFYEQALRWFRDLLRDPGDALVDQERVVDYLLRSYYDRGDYDGLRDYVKSREFNRLMSPGGQRYWQAMDAYVNGQWQQSAGLLAWFDRGGADEAWQRYEQRARRLQALTYVQLQELEKAESILAELVSETTGGESEQNRLDWGRILLNLNRPNDAQATWRPLLEGTNIPPGIVRQAQYLSARTHMTTGGYEQATLMLERLIDELREPGTLWTEAKLALADAYQAQGSMTQALAVVEQGLEGLTVKTAVRLLEEKQANLLLASGALEEASLKVMAYATSYADREEAGNLVLALGDAQMQSGMVDAALTTYQAYIEAFDDDSGGAYWKYGKALVAAERYSEAARAFDDAYERFDTDAHRAASLLAMADARFSNAQYRQAQMAYDRYVRSFPDATAAAKGEYQAALCTARLGDTRNALARYERVAERYAGSEAAEQALLSLADLLLERGSYEEAEAAFNRVMEEYPSSQGIMHALHGRGMARYHRWLPTGLIDFERVTAEAADQDLAAHARFMQAMYHYRLGRDERALEICRQIMSNLPDAEWAPLVLFWIARFEYNAGQYAAAEKTFMEFSDRFPQHDLTPQAVLRSGLAAVKDQQYVRGIERLGQIAARFPGSRYLAEARYYQAEAMVQLGRYAAAILLYEEVINQFPGNELAVLAWGRKGDCLYTLGSDRPERYEEAIVAYETVLSIPTVDADIRLQAGYKLGLVYERLDRESEALAQYYEGVVLPYLVMQERGEAVGRAGRTWFSRAVRGASAILEKQGAWRRLVNMLNRAGSTDTDVANEARRRAREIRAAYWWLFY